MGPVYRDRGLDFKSKFDNSVMDDLDYLNVKEGVGCLGFGGSDQCI